MVNKHIIWYIINNLDSAFNLYRRQPALRDLIPQTCYSTQVTRPLFSLWHLRPFLAPLSAFRPTGFPRSSVAPVPIVVMLKYIIFECRAIWEVCCDLVSLVFIASPSHHYRPSLTTSLRFFLFSFFLVFGGCIYPTLGYQTQREYLFHCWPAWHISLRRRRAAQVTSSAARGPPNQRTARSPRATRIDPQWQRTRHWGPKLSVASDRESSQISIESQLASPLSSQRQASSSVN